MVQAAWAVLLVNGAGAHEATSSMVVVKRTLRGAAVPGLLGHYEDSVGDASAGLLGQTPP